MADVEKNTSGASFPADLQKAMLEVWANPESMDAVRDAQMALAKAGLGKTHFLIRTKEGTLQARPFLKHGE